MELDAVENMIKEVLKDAIKRFRAFEEVIPILEEDLIWMSFPKSFGSTAGPFGGIGGQMMTSFQIILVQCGYFRETLIYANGRFWKEAEHLPFEYPKI